MWKIGKSLVSQGVRHSQTLLSQVAETVAPHAPRDLKKDLLNNWREINAFYKNEAVDTVDLAQTTVAELVEEMVQILCEEDLQYDDVGGPAPPCLSELLDRKILETLISFGKGDKPKGMRRLMMRTVTQLVSRMRRMIVTYMGVHASLKGLIRAYMDMGDPAVEGKDAVHMLLTVSQAIAQDPVIVNFFYDKPKGDQPAEMILFSALVASVDNFEATGNNARAGLIILTSLDNEDVATFISTQTPFTYNLIGALCKEFATLPMEHPTVAILENPSYLRYVELVQFCNLVAQNGHPKITARLVSVFQDKFLAEMLQPALQQPSDAGVAAAVVYARVLPQYLDEIDFVRCYTATLLGMDTEPESAAMGDDLRTALIHRMDDVEDSMSTGVLQLFDDLVGLDCREIMDNLVYRNMREPGAYLTEAAAEAAARSVLARESGAADTEGQDEEDRSLGAQHEAIRRILGLCAWAADTGDGFTEYVHDAKLNTGRVRFRGLALMPAGPGEGAGAPAGPEPFFEGAFLHVLLNRLGEMLDHSLDNNVVLTGILSKLVQFARPELYRFLMAPADALQPQQRSLVSVMEQVAQDIQARASRMPDFDRSLRTAQQALTHESDGTSQLDALQTFENKDFLQAVVVFEEFCKELSAVLQLKMLQ